jgi:hypothetical protein
MADMDAKMQADMVRDRMQQECHNALQSELGVK